MTGDQDDILNRIKQALPAGWFEGETPVLNAVLAGFAYAWAHVYALLNYLKLQTRIRTATDGWLDLIAGDFFGDTYQRRGRNDDTYRRGIIANLFRERGTRQGLRGALVDLTGMEPVIFEPQRLTDGMALGNTSFLGCVPMCTVDQLPFQCFVTVNRAPGSGILVVAGLGENTFGLGQSGVDALISMNQVQQAVTDQDIYETINRVKPAGTIVWTRIQP